VKIVLIVAILLAPAAQTETLHSTGPDCEHQAAKQRLKQAMG
jgi:hypothetical protein